MLCICTGVISHELIKFELEIIDINAYFAIYRTRRRKRELDYEQKKDLDRKEHLQARDWLQWKADFGSLAVASFATLQVVCCVHGNRVV